MITLLVLILNSLVGSSTGNRENDRNAPRANYKVEEEEDDDEAERDKSIVS